MLSRTSSPHVEVGSHGHKWLFKRGHNPPCEPHYCKLRILPPPAVVVAHVMESACVTETMAMVMVVQAMAAAQAERGYRHDDTPFKKFLVHGVESGLTVHLFD